MHLIRMLRVSDTFTAGEIPMGRYHVVGVKNLPRFSRGQPAIRTAARPGGGPCPVGDQPWETQQDAISSPTAVDGDAAPRSQKSAGAGVGATEESAPSRPTELEQPDGGWLIRLVHWLGDKLRRRRNPFSTAGPRISSTVSPRQGCLSMEGLQVVRNDLSDTDFEVVRSKRRRARSRDDDPAPSPDFREDSLRTAAARELRVSNL